MKVPHYRTIVGFCIAAIVGYAIFSVWAVFYSTDAAIRGDVVGTWKSFAVGAFAFWIGSSSGGKTKPEDPAPVTIVNPPSDPVPVDQAPAAQ